MRHSPLAMLCVVAPVVLAPQPAPAGDFVTTYETDTRYDYVEADLEDAIINRGFVIENRGKIGEMLKRTAKVVGATKTIYKHAEVLEFCSAVFSRAMMEADARNIAFCPLALFVYEAEADPGTVVVGFRRLPDGDGRDKVNSLLDEIARDAAGK